MADGGERERSEISRYLPGLGSPSMRVCLIFESLAERQQRAPKPVKSSVLLREHFWNAASPITHRCTSVEFDNRKRDMQ